MSDAFKNKDLKLIKIPFWTSLIWPDNDCDMMTDLISDLTGITRDTLKETGKPFLTTWRGFDDFKGIVMAIVRKRLDIDNVRLWIAAHNGFNYDLPIILTNEFSNIYRTRVGMAKSQTRSMVR